MDKTVTGITITIKNANEILRMGGPFVGDIWIGKLLIDKECIVDSFVYKEDFDLLFFIKYHQVVNYKYFTINFYDLTNGKRYGSDKEFEMVFINHFISKNELEIFHAHHNQLPGTRDVFNLDQENFELYNI